MDDKITLPPQLAALGDAMAPVLEALDAALAEKPRRTIPVGSITDVLDAGLDALGRSLLELERQVNRLAADVTAPGHATERDTWRAVGRLEGALDELVEGYRVVLRQDARGSDQVPCDLLAGTYRHSMRQIQAWLRDVVDTVADPRAALHRKGLPMSGHVVIELKLDLTPAPENEQLKRWLNSRSICTPSRAPKRARLGFADAVFASIIGVFIGTALFGDDE